MEPKVTLPNEETEVEKVIGGQSDLAYTLALEILPKIELGGFQGHQARAAGRGGHRRPGRRSARQDRRAEPAVRAPRARAQRSRRATASSSTSPAGSKARRSRAAPAAMSASMSAPEPSSPASRISSSAWRAGETRLVKVTFPANYMNAQLAGKAAEFDVTAKSIEAPGTVTVDDAFAKSLGLESLDKLKEAVKGRLQQEHAGAEPAEAQAPAARQARRDAQVRAAADAGRGRVQERLERGRKRPQGAGPHLRRRRHDRGEGAGGISRALPSGACGSGLVLAEIGEKNNITVTEDEITRAIVERARQVPGREQEVWDYYRKNPRGGARACARRSSRRRWSTSWSSSPR